MDELEVAPTHGLDGAHGVVRIVAVTCFEAILSYYPADSFLYGEDKYDDETRASAWYSFRYIDEALHDVWGIAYLPEELLESMVKSARMKSMESIHGRSY